jgi:hypothetical protein
MEKKKRTSTPGNGYKSLNEQMYQEKIRVLMGCYLRITPEEEKYLTDLAKRLEK